MSEVHVQSSIVTKICTHNVNNKIITHNVSTTKSFHIICRQLNYYPQCVDNKIITHNVSITKSTTNHYSHVNSKIITHNRSTTKSRHTKCRQLNLYTHCIDKHSLYTRCIDKTYLHKYCIDKILCAYIAWKKYVNAQYRHKHVVFRNF